MAVQAVLPCLVPALAQVTDERLLGWCRGLQRTQLLRLSCTAAMEQISTAQNQGSLTYTVHMKRTGILNTALLPVTQTMSAAESPSSTHCRRF